MNGAIQLAELFGNPIPFHIVPRYCNHCLKALNMYGKSNYCEVHRRRYDLKDLLIRDRELVQSKENSYNKYINKKITRRRRRLAHRIRMREFYNNNKDCLNERKRNKRLKMKEQLCEKDTCNMSDQGETRQVQTDDGELQQNQAWQHRPNVLA